jgi:hypothetical protein
MPSNTSSGQRALMAGIIILGILLTAFFGMRAFRAFRRFDGHRPAPPGNVETVETDVGLIRDWMTIPFISQTYQVPPEVIFEALNISPRKDHDKSLKVLNEEYYPDQDGFVLNIVQETILAHQSPPIPDSAPTAVPPLTAPAP